MSLDPTPTPAALRRMAARKGVPLAQDGTAKPPKRRKAPSVRPWREWVDGGRPVFLTIPGAPRTKKTSNKIWKVGNRKVVMPSEAWMAWRDDVVAHIAEHVPGVRTMRLAVPLNCRALFYRDANRGDAVGYYQGLADVLEEIGLLADDEHIVSWDGSRLLLDRVNPRVEVTLTPLAAGEVGR